MTRPAPPGRNLRRRASDRVRAKQEGLLGRLRLRHKLSLMLTVAALLPVLGASTVAIRLVLSGLKQGARAQTERTMRVALNLVLTHVKEVFEGTVRLSEAAGLSDLLQLDPASTAELLARRENQMLPGMVQVADAQGHLVGRHAVSGKTAKELEVGDGSEAIRHALAYERRVTIVRDARELIVRASAPVVDDGFQLRGAVVASVPLDAEFADRLKAQLAADVVIYVDDAPTASSFVAADGKREVGFAAPTEMARQVLGGQSRIIEARAFGRMYSVGYVPIQDLEGHRLGMLAVAVDEDALVVAKNQAWRSLAFGGLSAVVFALALATLLSRRLTRPLGHLHAGAIAVARGDLDHQIVPETGDEIGDLAVAFAQMTGAVKENQERLAARMREITTLHEIGRAVSSVLGLDEVLRKVVGEVAAVLAAKRCALLLTQADGTLIVGGAVGSGGPNGLPELCEAAAWRGGPVRIERVEDETDLQKAAKAANVTGSLMVVPLEQKDRLLGMLLVNRPVEGEEGFELSPFTDADLRLLATFADHASNAISYARLYDEVQKASEELEIKVKERTFDLVVANRELEQALDDLRAAQAALVHSERMAGLGQLVAGVAHEVNSPAAAIQGAVDNLADNVSRLARRARELGDLHMKPEDRTRFFALVEQLAPRLAQAKIEAPSSVRRQARELADSLSAHGVSGAEAICRTLVEIGAAEAAFQLAQLAPSSQPQTQTHSQSQTPTPTPTPTQTPTQTQGPISPISEPDKADKADKRDILVGLEALVGYLEQYAYLFRNTHSIRTAIRRITRIVGALKGYSHLDQAKVTPADIHEGIENTLVILHSELKYGITLTRKFAQLPAVPVYVDELNQVWTNLIHNAVQALGGEGIS